ncbi:MAG TPA: HAMP domain-containing sensor histidine kinase [Acidimicrobiia bacterium]|nr:HAMP domain-containing sensor histidine kinase [Acidimicrobiia bacterium]
MSAEPRPHYFLNAVRAFALAAAAVAFGYGLFLVVAGPPANFANAGVAYAGASMAAGIALTAAGLANKGRARVAWTLIGAGVACWGIGEIVWVIQGALTGEIPYPGVADFFYVAGYPFIFAGVVFLPYLRPGRYERIRLALDATAGTLSLAAVMWVAYLNRVVSVGADPIETILNLVYPFGDVLLATALMVLAMRRSEDRLDLKVLLVAAGVALTMVADVIFSLQVAADTFVEWTWLDGIWLFSYSAFALAAFMITRPSTASEHAYRPVEGWQLVAPYTAVASLFVIRLLMSSGNSLILNIATTAVAALIIGRQAVAIRERKELLEKQRDDLVASVSHELRTPLTGIQGYTQLLMDAGDALDPVERHEMLETINVSAGQLGHIVTDLINVARDRLQNVRLYRRPYLAADLVREAVATAATNRAVAIDVDPDVSVSADPDRVRQVLVNLLTNAIRYGRSQIKVVAREDGKAVVFAVHDDGDGVPTKHQSDIWQRFERGAYRHNATVPGSGIGLSVAKDLVIAHGGTIRYRPSDLLGGACFEFTLPTAERVELVGSTP